MNLTERIRQHAVELGFDLVGFAPAASAAHADHFRSWLDQGFHGEMNWLARDPDRRSDPRNVLPGCRSAVTVGCSYFVQDPPPEYWEDPARGRVARYAWGKDYHDVLEPKLKALSAFIRDEAPPETTARYYVDTGPVLEREVAATGGLGFIGKNSLLIHPGHGSYLFLAEVLVSCELDYDQPAADGGATWAGAGDDQVGTCGNCRRCLDICPTHAFPAPYILDSRLCISYLTIELKGAIPESLRPPMKNWIYGCDECQSVCPWVKQYAKPKEENFLAFDPDVAAPRLVELMALDDEEFRRRFKGTPMRRTKRRGLLRNVAVALGNWGDVSAKPVLEKALSDPEPLIREHAAWALERLG